MPEFHYTALSKTGGEVQGREFADSAEALKTLLKKRRLILVKAKARKASRVAKGTVARLIAELADLAESDVVLERALQVLSEDRRDPAVSSLSSALREELKSGNSLSQAFAKLGRIDPLVAPMLRAGEATGQLAGMLRRLSDHFEQANDLRREVRASLAYPSILLVVSLLSLIGLALYVVPVFRELFEDNLADLPVGTRIVFGISDWLVQNGTLAFGVSAAVLITLLLGFRHVPPLRDLAHRSMFALPLFGEIAALRQSASLTGVLGVLLSSGVPLVQAMQIAGETATNRYMRKLLARAHSEIRQGAPFTSAMNRVHVLPIVASRLMGIGDESGRLGPACSKASQLLEKTLRSRLKSLVALVEPITILTMGGVVGFVVVSMLLAVFGLTDLAG
jgi:type II secretory pathway component PulF